MRDGMMRKIQSPPMEKLPGPWRITFDTNPDDCNLHCIMCEEHSLSSPKYELRKNGTYQRRVMEYELIEQVVAECTPKGLREIIPSTMGEPLLYQEFPKIIALCQKYGIKLNLTTNGTFPEKGVEEWARLICPVGSDVKISWNGVTPELQESIMVGSPYYKRLNDLKAFLQVRNQIAIEGGNYCRVTLQLTFMDRTLQETPEVVRFAIDLGIDRVKGHHLWVHTEEMEKENLRRSADSVEHWNKVVKNCHEIIGSNRLPNGKRIQLTNFTLLDPENREELDPMAICPFLGQEAWVNHAGRFDPCCAPDELRQSLGYIGDARDDGLLVLWNSEKYDDLVNGYLENELCRGCNMRVIKERLS